MHIKTIIALPTLLTLTLLVAASPALAYRHTQYEKKTYTKSTRVVTQPYTPPASTPTPVPTSPTPTSPVPAAEEVYMSAYVTGYSYWDNTPAGTAEISHPMIHQKAGGTGTFVDPITLAVGHSIINGKDILDYPAGTKFYLPYLQKYAIVEDTCGDGNTPQNGPCHTGYKGNVWIDIYVDGAGTSRAVSDTCMDNITAVHTVIKNPIATYPASAGSITATGCKIY